MKIVLLSLFLLCGQLLFANFSQPVSAPHSLVLSQSVDNQLKADFKTPLLPIEPAKPQNRETLPELFNPFVDAGLLLLLGILGLVLFSAGLNAAIAWLWLLALGLEALAISTAFTLGIWGYCIEPKNRKWLEFGTFYELYLAAMFLFFLPKSIQLLLLSFSLAMPLLLYIGIAAAAIWLILGLILLV